MSKKKQKTQSEHTPTKPARADKRAAKAKPELSPEDDPLSTLHPVRNPMAEVEDLPSAVAPTIKSIDFEWLKCNPPKIVMNVTGESGTGPWTKVRLEPWFYINTPSDGIWDFDLCGIDAGHLLFVPEKINAQYNLGTYRLGDPHRRGVRIHGVKEGVLEKLFVEESDQAARGSKALKEPDTAAAGGRGISKLEKFRVPLATKGVVLYRAGEWELYFFFRQRGTKSEGPTGVLLQNGSVKPASEQPVETELGTLRYVEDDGILFHPQGWAIDGFRPNSWDYPDIG